MEIMPHNSVLDNQNSAASIRRSRVILSAPPLPKFNMHDAAMAHSPVNMHMCTIKQVQTETQTLAKHVST